MQAGRPAGKQIWILFPHSVCSIAYGKAYITPMLEQQNDMIIIVSFFFSLKIMIISCFNFTFKLYQIFFFLSFHISEKKRKIGGVCFDAVQNDWKLPTSIFYFIWYDRRAIMPMIIIIQWKRNDETQSKNWLTTGWLAAQAAKAIDNMTIFSIHVKKHSFIFSFIFLSFSFHVVVLLLLSPS